jgi:hypothetical protein
VKSGKCLLLLLLASFSALGGLRNVPRQDFWSTDGPVLTILATNEIL